MPQIVLNGTTGIANATWTTATRPASPVAGQTGYNTDIGAMETYTGSAWSTSDLPATGASGNFLQSNGTAWTSASTLGVANGGTGVTTLTTAYGVLAAGTTATGALQNIGTGTANQVLTSNGPGVLPSWAAAAGGQLQTQVFTSPGTWTKPSSTTQVRVTVIGGGGGGGANNPGTSGGTSSFGSSVTCTGGGINGSTGSATVSLGSALKTSNLPVATTPWANYGGIVGPVTGDAGGPAVSYSASSIMAGTYGVGLGGQTPSTPGGWGGMAQAIVPVSSPVAITVGTGGNAGSSPIGSRAGWGMGGAVLVEFVG